MDTLLIVGLGNPGSQYAHSRHNAGFMVLDQYAGTLGLRFRTSSRQALFLEQRRADRRLILLKPQTYMNLSGLAVVRAVGYYKLQVSDVLVVYDDLDTPLGRLRLREGGGHGGQNGMRSIIAALGTTDIRRIRLGVGRPPPGWEATSWVLAPFTAEERPSAEEMITRATEALAVVWESGFQRAMNQFNSG